MCLNSILLKRKPQKNKQLTNLSENCELINYFFLKMGYNLLYFLQNKSLLKKDFLYVCFVRDCTALSAIFNSCGSVPFVNFKINIQKCILTVLIPIPRLGSPKSQLLVPKRSTSSQPSYLKSSSKVRLKNESPAPLSARARMI